MRLFARCDFEGIAARALCEDLKKLAVPPFKLLRAPPPTRRSPRARFLMLDHLPKLPSAFAEGQVAWMYEQPTSESLPVLQKEGTLLELRRVTFFHGNDFHLLGTLSMFPKYPRRKNA